MDPMLDPQLFQMLFGSTAMTPVVPPVVPPPMPAPTMAPMMGRPAEPYMTDPLVPGGQTPQVPVSAPASLGASLEPQVPMPQPRPAEAPGGANANANAAEQAGNANKSAMLSALKGVVAPAAPQAQKVSTPHAPAMAKLAGGNVAELLAALGIGPQQAFPGLKLPSTLGQALGR